jgi:N6-adenosine-specific RNA methylase IME4
VARGEGAAGEAMTYSVVLADPPWDFNTWGDNDSPRSRDPDNHYQVMSVEDICAIPMGNLCAPNCVLFMWGCWPQIFDTRLVAEAWGFTYRTIAWVWVKANPTGFGHFMGLGYYTRANTEPCLLFVRGTMPVAARDVLSLIYASVREHSKKPEEQYAKIERLYPNGRYLEMFARRKHSERWDVWGNEVESDVEIIGC